MIRRIDRSDWLVIAQIEHARLAGELARAWRNDRVAGLAWGIEHHDDGWREWDDAPRLNPATGFPRSFLEMRMRDSTALWTRSIAICSADPLAGIAVSRHFCYLAEQSRNSGRADADDRESIERFLREQSEVEAALADAGRSQHAAAATDGAFEQSCDLAFQTVRFFDGMSLWLCCAERDRPEPLFAPRGQAVQLIPRSPSHIAIEPYPLRVDTLRLETPVRRIAARRYANEPDLEAALRAAPAETLTWTFART